jgi:hypothetical protein
MKLKASLRNGFGDAALIVALLMSLKASPQQTQRTASSPVAEGEYSQPDPRTGGPRRKIPISRWRLYEHSDGSYLVEIELLPLATPDALERLSMDHEFKAYAMSVFIPAVDLGPVRISCDYGSVVRCSRLEGERLESTPIQGQPYCFVPFSDPRLFYDPPWFYQCLVSQARAARRTRTPVALFTFKAGTSATGGTVGISEVLQVEYVGREKVEVLNQILSAQKYQLRGGKDSHWTQQDLWVSSTGLLLKATLGYGPAAILTAYHGPPLD